MASTAPTAPCVVVAASASSRACSKLCPFYPSTSRWRERARLWADLWGRGEMIGAHDLIIAATALVHDFAVLSRNQRHFGRIEGLRVIAGDPPKPAP